MDTETIDDGVASFQRHYSAVGFAHDVLEMRDRIEQLEYENARLREYEQKYHELLGETLAHNEKMVFGVFQVGMEMARLKDAAREEK